MDPDRMVSMKKSLHAAWEIWVTQKLLEFW